jgi:hypothetical protein
MRAPARTRAARFDQSSPCTQAEHLEMLGLFHFFAPRFGMIPVFSSYLPYFLSLILASRPK